MAKICTACGSEMGTLLRVLLLSLLVSGCDIYSNSYGESYPDIFVPRDPVFLHCLKDISDDYNNDIGIIFDRANNALYEFDMSPSWYERSYLQKATSSHIESAGYYVSAPAGTFGHASVWRYGSPDTDNPNTWRTQNFPRLKSEYQSDVGYAFVIDRVTLTMEVFRNLTDVSSHKCIFFPSWDKLEEKPWT